MIALTVQKWSVDELTSFKNLLNKQRGKLRTICECNPSCTKCPVTNLCMYYRDAFIVTSKELEKRLSKQY